ncbi:hypothetical protein [Pseudalkalibacillus salsuginis]|uniref:hypothetical protein n=1 Tax=Pseudalkalibacillus salsuginis TaxID=2910972 RepID=UPI001CD2389F|nr:hypothetical protein [Pseudalkalibacillus salsuginis]MCF6408759.1 hypothetical protein [Pseudalkalibacillus salsuginis]
MIINRKEMARAKVEKLKNGYSAFAETKEVAELIKKQAAELNIEFVEDVTEIGSWFIPAKR